MSIYIVRTVTVKYTVSLCSVHIFPMNVTVQCHYAVSLYKVYILSLQNIQCHYMQCTHFPYKIYTVSLCSVNAITKIIHHTQCHGI